MNLADNMPPSVGLDLRSHGHGAFRAYHGFRAVARPEVLPQTVSPLLELRGGRGSLDGRLHPLHVSMTEQGAARSTTYIHGKPHLGSSKTALESDPVPWSSSN